MFAMMSTAGLVMLGLVSAGEVNFLEAGASPSIAYNETLTCTPCIVGGYAFCTQGAKIQKCCKTGDQECRTDLGCSDQQYQDKFQALFKTCHSNFRPDVCGSPNVIQINKADQKNKTVIDVSKMGLDDGCTFKVFSKCSWPKLIANTTDIDILVASF
jgi:hypothetical protein